MHLLPEAVREVLGRWLPLVPRPIHDLFFLHHPLLTFVLITCCAILYGRFCFARWRITAWFLRLPIATRKQRFWFWVFLVYTLVKLVFYSTVVLGTTQYESFWAVGGGVGGLMIGLCGYAAAASSSSSSLFSPSSSPACVYSPNVVAKSPVVSSVGHGAGFMSNAHAAGNTECSHTTSYSNISRSIIHKGSSALINMLCRSDDRKLQQQQQQQQQQTSQSFHHSHSSVVWIQPPQASE